MDEQEQLVSLELIKIGASFLCPWNGKTFILHGLTSSAAWVTVVEELEVERKNKKTGEIKVIIQKIKKNEPWSKGTKVKAL